VPLPIAILGATGIVGEQVLARLPASALGAQPVVAFGSRASKVDAVACGDARLPVRPLEAVDDVQCALAFSCLPAPVAARTLPALAARGVTVLDLGNSLHGLSEAPLVLPGADLPAAQDVAAHGLARLPSGTGWLLARLLHPLREAGVREASATVMLPAASHGRAAVDELSEQVVATFNLKDAPRRVFPEGLAFDVLVDPAEDGECSPRELQAIAEVEALAGVAVSISVVTAPVFAGAMISLELRGTSIDAVEEAWRDAPGLKAAARSAPRPRRMLGKRSVTWGGLREAGREGVVLVAAAADPASGVAADAVSVAEWLFENGVVSAREAW
jgi:aspartate-semialdehyde dehydrogenase